MQRMVDNNVSNSIDMDDHKNISLGINNALGNNTPQKIDIWMNLCNAIKLVSTSPPSDLSRNKTDTA